MRYRHSYRYSGVGGNRYARRVGAYSGFPRLVTNRPRFYYSGGRGLEMTVYRLPVEISYSDAGSPGVNVWHVRTEESFMVSTSQLQAATDAIRGFYSQLSYPAGGGAGIWAGGTTFRLGTVVDVATQEVATPAWPDLEFTSSSADAFPGLAIVVNWRTSLAARRARGRTFLGPLGADTVATDGRIASSARATVLAAAQYLVDASDNVNGWAVGVYGLQTPNTGPTGTKVLRDITGHTVGLTFGVLRSRRD